MNTPNLDQHRVVVRRVRLLVGAYLAVSVATLVAIVLLRHHAAVVNAAVWIRGTIVVASALLMTAFAARTARGSRGAYRRLRIVSAIMVVAIVTIIALPGTFPLWMKLDQAACGLLLIGVLVLVNGRHLRSAFAMPSDAMPSDAMPSDAMPSDAMPSESR